MLRLNVEQHQREHSDTPINLKKCILSLIQADIFVATPNPQWMEHLDKDAAHSMKFRSKLMQKAISELLLEIHITSVANSISSVHHAKRISKHWLRRALDNKEHHLIRNYSLIREHVDEVEEEEGQDNVTKLVETNDYDDSERLIGVGRT